MEWRITLTLWLWINCVSVAISRDELCWPSRNECCHYSRRFQDLPQDHLSECYKSRKKNHALTFWAFQIILCDRLACGNMAGKWVEPFLQEKMLRPMLKVDQRIKDIKWPERTGNGHVKKVNIDRFNLSLKILLGSKQHFLPTPLPKNKDLAD